MKNLFAVSILLSLCCAVSAVAVAQMVPGCGPMIPGSTLGGANVPNGCAPMVPIPSSSGGSGMLLTNSGVQITNSGVAVTN